MNVADLKPKLYFPLSPPAVILLAARLILLQGPGSGAKPEPGWRRMSTTRHQVGPRPHSPPPHPPTPLPPAICLVVDVATDLPVELSIHIQTRQGRQLLLCPSGEGPDARGKKAKQRSNMLALRRRKEIGIQTRRLHF